MLFNVNGDSSLPTIVNCIREGMKMIHLLGKPLIKFQVMLGLVLQHNSPSGQPQFSYYEPSMNTAFSKGRLFVYSASGLEQFQNDVKNVSMHDVIASNFSKNSKDCIYATQTVQVRYFY